MSSAFENYKVFQAIIDIILFREKYSNIKKAYKIKKMMDEYENHNIFKGKYIKLLNNIFDLNKGDIRTAIYIHNKYTKNDDVITNEVVQEYVTEYLTKVKKFIKNTVIFVPKKRGNARKFFKQLDTHLDNLIESITATEDK